MVHGKRCPARLAAARCVMSDVLGCRGGDRVTLVMGMDQHRAQISAEWIDTITGRSQPRGSHRLIARLSAGS